MKYDPRSRFVPPTHGVAMMDGTEAFTICLCCGALYENHPEATGALYDGGRFVNPAKDSQTLACICAAGEMYQRMGLAKCSTEVYRQRCAEHGESGNYRELSAVEIERWRSNVGGDASKVVPISSEPEVLFSSEFE